MLKLLAILANILSVWALMPDKLNLNDDNLLFDRGTPVYETVLTPADFEMGAQLSEAMQFNSGEIWDSDAMYGTTRFEGDIANPNLNASTIDMFMNGGGVDSSDGKSYNAIKNRHQLWPNGRIPYTISSQYSSYSRSLIAASMEEYAKHTCIRWVPKEGSDVNYVYIYPDRGCYSMVGKMGGKQVISLGSGCIQKGIIIHELMHAVGFFHEQSRTDRDDFITIMWQNIQSGMEGQFEKYGTGTISALGTTYDYTSIMHYGTKAFSKNGQPTMVPKQKGAEIGQRNGFSKVDTFKINTLYGCQVGSTTPSGPEPTRFTTAPTTTTSSPFTGECKNTRGDCDELAKNGWCQRNPGWMKTYCPISCGFCKKPATVMPTLPSPKPINPHLTTTQPPTPPPTRPSVATTMFPILPTVKPTPTSECEDYRVDCPTLVKQRYCYLAASFMKSYCAMSCGFCSKPIPTEIPDTTPHPTVVTDTPLVTFYPTSPRPHPSPPTTSATVPPAPMPCKDKKHFCSHWKSAGFCTGIFASYMKKNCPASCGHC